MLLYLSAKTGDHAFLPAFPTVIIATPFFTSLFSVFTSSIPTATQCSTPSVFSRSSIFCSILVRLVILVLLLTMEYRRQTQQALEHQTSLYFSRLDLTATLAAALAENQIDRRGYLAFSSRWR